MKLGSIILVFSTLSLSAQHYKLNDAVFAQKLRTIDPTLVDNQNRLDTNVAKTFNGSLRLTSSSIVDLDGIQYFKSLKELIADGNNISSFEAIKNLSQLELLNCKSNNLTQLPSFSKLSKLKELDCSINKLNFLPNLDSCKQLRTIYAYMNNMGHLPRINHLDSLRYLDVQLNKLTSFPRTDSMASIQQILLYKNLLSAMPDFSKNTTLTFLQIHYNQIPSSPITKLPLNLPKLIIDGNNLTFKDLTELSKMINFSNFSYSNQKEIQIAAVAHVQENSAFTLDTKTDENVIDNIYVWYKDGMVVASNSTPQFKIEQTSISDQGFYEATIRNPNFPDFYLKTTKLQLYINKCQDKNCKDLYLEPNGDGIADEIWINAPGNIRIIDRFGKKVAELNGPNYWSGLNIKNEKLPTGTYLAIFEDGNQQRISIAR